jgi:RNA polymerase sigma factor (sigma-70 family)
MFFRRDRARDSVATPQVLDALAAEVRDAQAGDPAATRRVLDGVGPEVARVARAVLGDGAADLDDVVQDTLVSFLKALPAFRGECSIRRFAHRIAARTAIAARRRGRARAIAHVAPEEQVSEHDRPDSRSLAFRRQQLLGDLLETLPEAQAETMALRVVLGMTLAEVALATRAPENTVRSRLRLAREALRERIEADPKLLELLSGGP